MVSIRQPIITVAGHVDHGKTSLLDCFRGTSVQEGEAGGITQKISFTRCPLEQMHKACPLLDGSGIAVKIPGFLFIDTPGHAAFTNLRKRGGSLADLAILVVDIKEGIKPQTAEVISILKTHKTPFVVALNKLDTISGWQKKASLKESIQGQATHVTDEFNTALFTFQGSLHSYGFDSDLYYDIDDFSKKVAIVPCSTRSKEGISELLFVLCGLCQKFLGNRLTKGSEAKGVILEIKKEKSIDRVESILYDGVLSENDEIAIASFGEPIVSKVRAIEEIQPLSFKYSSVKRAEAATGIRMQLTNKEGLLSGMPFQVVNNNLKELLTLFKKEVGESIKTDKDGVIAKADSLGSLEALITLLHESNIHVLKAGIGTIGKGDIISGKAIVENNPLDGVIVGFNVAVEEDVDFGNVTVFTHDVVYKLIEDLVKWRKEKSAEIEREKMLGLATICKLELLHQFVFRNSNPAIVGVKVVAGTLKKNIPLIDESGEPIAHVKGIQSEKHSVDEAETGKEVAVSLPGVNHERQLAHMNYLYSQLSESQFKEFKKNKELLGAEELKVLQEIADIKRRKNSEWGL